MLFQITQASVVNAAQAYNTHMHPVSVSDVARNSNQLWQALLRGELVGEYQPPTMYELLEIPNEEFYNVRACLQEWATLCLPVFEHLTLLRHEKQNGAAS